MQIVKPNTNYPFLAKSKPFIIVSLVLVLAALVLPWVIEPNLGTSFRGGSTIVVSFEKEVSSQEVREAFKAHPEFQKVSVQEFGTAGDNRYMIKTSNTTTLSCDKLASMEAGLVDGLKARGKDAVIESWPTCEGEGVKGDFFVRFKANENAVQPSGDDVSSHFDLASGVSTDELEAVFAGIELDAIVTFDAASRRFVVKPSGLQADVVALLVEAFPDRFNPETGLDEIVTVGADVGEKFRNDGIVSILFALGLILLYIAIRFDIRYAPGAVVALIHDVLITFGIIVITQTEITLETVAALLAIVGYSLNDTIVTFDRIRENVSAGTDEDMPTVVNRAINECLSRTLLTSITTLVAIVSLAVIGTGVIKDFATTLVIGVLVGTYSSIFIASPVMLAMDRWQERRKRTLEARKKMEGAAESAAS